MLNSPTIVCPELPPFDAENLDVVRRAFQRAPGAVLRQSWRPEPQPDFVPATAWAGWRDSTLFVFGKLTDATIVTFATRENERLWELGDVLEIFLRPPQQTAYSEIQIAPNNLRLQLRYANAAALEKARKNNSIGEALVPKISFQSRVWQRPEMNCWFVLAEIPAASVCDVPAPLRGSTWQFSFCRYDYTRGGTCPVISSSSLLSQPDFHRLAEWGTLQFV
jgi:hypothetical protein